MDAILKEFENLEKNPINKPLISSIDRIIALLEETKHKVENGSSLIPRETAEVVC